MRRLNDSWTVAIMLAAVAACASPEASAPAGGGQGDAAPSDTPATDAQASDSGCKGGTPCKIGQFCNDQGNCCPALGCFPQCPNGIALDSAGCETCQCATAKACNPLSMSPTAQCTASEYCATPVGLCGSSQGTCTPLPAPCAAIYQPVCGCDGKTYSSECAAGTAGISVSSSGACK